LNHSQGDVGWTGKHERSCSYQSISNIIMSYLHPSDSPSSANLRPASAALFLGLSASYLAKLRLTGDGPAFYKVGRAVVYRSHDLESWLAAHGRRASTSDRAGVQ
jgi:hypothetical protein